MTLPVFDTAMNASPRSIPNSAGYGFNLVGGPGAKSGSQMIRGRGRFGYEAMVSPVTTSEINDRSRHDGELWIAAGLQDPRP